MARLMLSSPQMRLVQAARGGSIWGRFAFAVLSVLAVLVASADARAQQVTGILNTVLRVEPNGSNADSVTTGNPHPGGVPQNVINYEDCAAALSFEFTLSLSAVYPQYDLVAWAGPTDCTAASAREGSTATCWPLTAGPIVQGTGTDEAGAPVTTIELSMQQIASQAGIAAGAVSPIYTPATSAACSVQPTSAATSIAIYFFFTDHVAPGNAIGIAQAYPIIVDTAAQNVGNSGFSVAEDLDSQLTVTISATSDTDTVAFNVYCDPPPGQETSINQIPYDAATNRGICIPDSAVASDALASTSDGSGDSGGDSGDGGNVTEAEDAASVSVADSAPPTAILDDAGANVCGVPLGDSGVPSYGSCSAGSVLQPGGGTEGTTLVPEVDDAGDTVTNEAGGIVYVEAGILTGGKETVGIPSKYLCGTVSVSSPTLTITGLRDGYYYTIGVAAVDGAGNVGPLATSCGEPVQLADFWYNYTSGGGQAGGGYCSAAEGIGVPAGTSGLGILMVASIIAIVRKRRTARQEPDL